MYKVGRFVRCGISIWPIALPRSAAARPESSPPSVRMADLSVSTSLFGIMFSPKKLILGILKSTLSAKSHRLEMKRENAISSSYSTTVCLREMGRMRQSVPKRLSRSLAILNRFVGSIKSPQSAFSLVDYFPLAGVHAQTASHGDSTARFRRRVGSSVTAERFAPFRRRAPLDFRCPARGMHDDAATAHKDGYDILARHSDHQSLARTPAQARIPGAATGETPPGFWRR